MSQTMSDIITIFGRVLDIDPDVISVKFCAILQQKILSYCDFHAFADVYYFGNY